MNTIRKILIISVSTLLILSNLNAQAKKDFTVNLSNNMFSHYSKQINLTDSQKVELRKFVNEYEKKMKTIQKKSDVQVKKQDYNLTYQEFRVFWDKLLTQEQKDSIRIKKVEKIKLALTSNLSK